jgi:hypothetical protein
VKYSALFVGFLLSFTAVQAQQVPNPLSQTQTYAFPPDTFKELTTITVNPPYPEAAQLTPGVHGLVSKMVVPSTATQTPHPNSPMSAWMKSYNATPGNSSTAYFGGSFTGADGANPYGMTLTTCNCDGFGALPGAGHNFAGAQVGYEIDIETLSRPGGLAPAGQALGFLANSYSDIQPAGGSLGFAARDQGSAGGFTYAFYSEDGAGLVGGLRLGSKTRPSDTPSSNGQPIEFRARTANVTETGTLQYQQGGNLIFFPGKPGGSLATTGHLGAATVPATTVVVSACGTGASAGTSNDTRGVITVGSGTNSCNVAFGQAFAGLPTCVLTHSGGLSIGFITLQPDHMTVGFPLTTGATPFSYVCMQ